ncbi:MAG TPA: formate hydrogenlyase [Bacteroidetes bacterium]|nr:formate hydrogenlyase [Bacteroidota bacterium]
MNAINLILIVIGAILIPGSISWLKAKFSGRKGASIFQPIYDMRRSFKKGSVYSTTTSLIFKLAPTLSLAAILTCMLTLPFSSVPGFLAFDGDFLLFAYLLALGRFIMIAGALDTGSGFEGMGANREALYGMLIEPAFFILLSSFALLTDHDSFFNLFQNLHFGSYLSYLLAFLGAFILFSISMIENSRMPVDDPKTHLELTMVHEVMILDHSGYDLGLIQVGNSLKFGIFALLITNLLLPEGSPYYAHFFIFGGVIALYSLAGALVESFRARNKMLGNPRFILTVGAVAVLLFFSSLIITHKFIL